VDPRVVLEAAVGKGKIYALLDKSASFKNLVSLSLSSIHSSPFSKDKRNYVIDKNVFFYSRDLIPKQMKEK
jgi:hypothetical protein